jgi:hypothetical protein
MYKYYPFVDTNKYNYYIEEDVWLSKLNKIKQKNYNKNNKKITIYYYLNLELHHDIDDKNITVFKTTNTFINNYTEDNTLLIHVKKTILDEDCFPNINEFHNTIDLQEQIIIKVNKSIKIYFIKDKIKDENKYYIYIEINILEEENIKDIICNLNKMFQ